MKRILIPAVGAAACVLSACASPTGAPGPAPEPVRETVVVTETAAPQAPAESRAPHELQPPAPQESQPAAPQESQPPKRGVPGAPLAYPGAGGPVPPEARPVRSIKTLTHSGMQIAVFKAPSGNIGCMMNLEAEPMFDCGVKSFMDSGKLGTGELGTPLWVAEILHGYVREQTDPPLYYDEVWPAGSIPAEIVQYGEVVYHGPYVCAVEETGVTCWDSVSGRGAWLERDNIVFF